MSTKWKVASALATMAVFCLAGVPAMATPVTDWSFTVDAGFSTYVSTGGGHAGITAGPNNTLIGAPAALSWGVSQGSGQSGLDLGGTNGHATGVITTNNPTATSTVTVTAHNHPITGDTLKSGTIHDVLTLTATNPNLGSITLPQLSFDILYNETPNSGTCAAPPQNNPCSDILVISNLANGGFNTSDPANVFIEQNLPFQGEDYIVQLFITGLQALNKAECDSVNTADQSNVPSPGCIGLFSQENTDNHFQASLKILDNGPITNVPEPATIALFGMGLGGLVRLRRRRRA